MIENRHYDVDGEGGVARPARIHRQTGVSMRDITDGHEMTALYRAHVGLRRAQATREALLAEDPPTVTAATYEDHHRVTWLAGLGGVMVRPNHGAGWLHATTRTVYRGSPYGG